MVENQPEICLNLVEDIMEDEDEDLISRLPDYLLVEFLSRLSSTKEAAITVEFLSHLSSTKEAARTGSLSKRWKHVWTLLPNLVFRNRTLNTIFFSFMDKTLAQRGRMKLKSFIVSTCCLMSDQSHVNNWIRYAVSCNVEDFRVRLWSPIDDILIVPDQCLFTSSSFTKMYLVNFQLNPTGAISWKKLTHLYLSSSTLDNDHIENILSGSPLLETLVLNQCRGYSRLNVTSKILKKLGIHGHNVIGDDCTSYSKHVLEINAPNILSLEFQQYFYLWKVLLINVSALVEAQLSYYKGGYYESTMIDAEEEMLKGFILNLQHVKELKIGSRCLTILSRLEGKGLSIPSNVKVIKLEKCDLELSHWPGVDSDESRDSDGSDDDSDSDESNDEDESSDEEVLLHDVSWLLELFE